MKIIAHTNGPLTQASDSLSKRGLYAIKWIVPSDESGVETEEAKSNVVDMSVTADATEG